MKPSDKLRILMGLEEAEHKVSMADELLKSAKAETRDAVIKTVGLDPTVGDIDSLRAQVSASILLVIQADKIVRSTERIVSLANDAVEIARLMHLTAGNEQKD